MNRNRTRNYLEEHLSGSLNNRYRDPNSPLGLDNNPRIQYNYNNNNALNQQRIRSTISQWETEFPGSKRECQEELRRIKDMISKQEYAIVKYLTENQNKILASMDQEYTRVRAEILRHLDATYEQNKRKLVETIRSHRNSDLVEIEGFNKRLNDIKAKIESFERELGSNPAPNSISLKNNNNDKIGADYKRGIATVVTHDFETDREELMRKIDEALKRYQSTVYFRLDQPRYQHLKDDIHNLFVFYSSSESFMSNPGKIIESTIWPPVKEPVNAGINYHKNRDMLTDRQRFRI